MDTVFKVIAVVGAAAWISPIVVPWIIDTFIKPKLKIIPHKILEVGYTTFGPLLNINLAFSGDNKDALIEKINLNVKHQNGEERQFEWEWFEETLMQLNNPDSGITPLSKNQRAIALRIFKNSLIEKKVGFQIADFQEDYNSIFYRTNEVFNNKLAANEPIESIKASNEYNEFETHFDNWFIWKLGEYDVTIEVYVKGVEKPYCTELKFKITDIDAKTLKKNIDTCKKLLAVNYGVINDPEYKERWSWVNPRIIKK